MFLRHNGQTVRQPTPSPQSRNIKHPARPSLLNKTYYMRSTLLLVLFTLIGIDYWSSYYLVNNNPHVYEMNPLLAMIFELVLDLFYGCYKFRVFVKFF